MKSKKPLFIIYNDMHLGTGNEEAILVSIRHMISYALENDLDTVVFNGDFFHSRSNQTQSVLTTATEIFKLIHEAGLRHIINVGNHDKQSYFLNDSYLDVYKYHPGVKLYDDVVCIKIKGVSCTLMPFWDDSILVPKIAEAKGSDLLIGHFEMQGSAHLGKVSEKTTITPKTLSKFKKVYLGHYHNTMEITEDIIHLPSLRQSSFGEDSNKGFSVIFDDLSYEIIPGVFKKFNKLVLKIDELTSKDIKNLIDTHKNSEDVIRFEFVGTEANLKAIDKNQFKDTNIDVKLKFDKSFDLKEVAKPVLIKKFDKTSVYENFKRFCDDKNYDYIQGLAILDEFFKRN